MGVEKENNELGQISMKHKIDRILEIIYLIMILMIFLLVLFTSCLG